MSRRSKLALIQIICVYNINKLQWSYAPGQLVGFKVVSYNACVWLQKRITYHNKAVQCMMFIHCNILQYMFTMQYCTLIFRKCSPYITFVCCFNHCMSFNMFLYCFNFIVLISQKFWNQIWDFYIYIYIYIYIYVCV